MSELPIREKILQALAGRVNASRGLESYDGAALPITILVEGEDGALDPDFDLTRLTMPVVIARAIERSGLKGDDWYTAANESLAELIQEAYAPDTTFDGLADGIDYTGGNVGMLTDGAQGYTVQVNLEIRYAFLHGNPYDREVE